MQPLIEIKTVPISIEFKVTNAQFKPVDTEVQLEMQRDEGGLKIKSSPVRLNLDSYEARKSASNESVTDSVRTYGAKGKQAAYQATARYTQEGNILMNVQLTDEAFQQIADLRLHNNEHKTPNIKWIPDRPVDIQYEPGNLSIQYQMDKLNFDFKQNKRPMEFVPGDIELIVKQRPEVQITYVGGPIYVPPSADPSYEAPAE